MQRSTMFFFPFFVVDELTNELDTMVRRQTHASDNLFALEIDFDSKQLLSSHRKWIGQKLIEWNR